MANLSKMDFEAAEERGQRLADIVPHALTIRFDRKSERLIIDLTNGSTFAVPARMLQGLEHATPDQIEDFEISGDGYGLHWNALDADFTVHGLLVGGFGTKAHMALLKEQGAFKTSHNRAA
jgi:Protein of unknown function (DUF2442)